MNFFNYSKNRWLWISLCAMVAIMLWTRTQTPAPVAVVTPTAKTTSVTTQSPAHSDWPEAVFEKKSPAVQDTTDLTQFEKSLDPKRLVSVQTDVFNLQFDRVGGDLIRVDLKKFLNGRASETHPDDPIQLINSHPEKLYLVQSGLLSLSGPDQPGQRAWYTGGLQSTRDSNHNQIIEFQTVLENGVRVTKQYTLQPASYNIQLQYQVQNPTTSTLPYQARLYGRIKRHTDVQVGESFFMMRAFHGVAFNTDKKPFYKLTFDQLQKKSFETTRTGGWTAMVDHYFLSAWIPDAAQQYDYSTERFSDSILGTRFLGEPFVVQPGQNKVLKTQLYIGPEHTKVLAQLSPGLELTADYGMLWPICQPVFWLLHMIQSYVHNWGLAIILVTVLIKALFFNLSATSYRSMAKMRKLQPRLEKLKATYGDDRQKMGEAMMALYKEEKINPLGGCLPILVQIPVFIALYYVLLGSVELRQAPFFGWIQDLSTRDPYYILPILMGATMLIQQRLSPAPPDPIQAKMMMLMPIIFTVLFLQFPSGLVLYWLVNNLLSIGQQWLITRRLESSSTELSTQLGSFKSKSKSKKS